MTKRRSPASGKLSNLSGRIQPLIQSEPVLVVFGPIPCGKNLFGTVNNAESGSNAGGMWGPLGELGGVPSFTTPSLHPSPGGHSPASEITGRPPIKVSFCS